MNAPDFEIIEFPAARLATSDVGRFGLRKHSMYGLLEVDVTAARRGLRDARRRGEEISLTAWLVKTIGDCAARNPLAHAIRYGRRRLVAFKDVDISIVIERVVEGSPVPLPLVIRNVNARSARDVEAEIRAAREKPISRETDSILGAHAFSRAILGLYYRLPQALRLLAWKRLFSDPFRAKKHSGTIMVTTVSAVGGSPGWILPTRTLHNLSLAFGSITRKPWVVHGEVTARDILNLTVTFNHDVIDGVPARRFVQDLVASIESFGARG